MDRASFCPAHRKIASQFLERPATHSAQRCSSCAIAKISGVLKVDRAKAGFSASRPLGSSRPSPSPVTARNTKCTTHTRAYVHSVLHVVLCSVHSVLMRAGVQCTTLIVRKDVSRCVLYVPSALEGLAYWPWSAVSDTSYQYSQRTPSSVCTTYT